MSTEAEIVILILAGFVQACAFLAACRKARSTAGLWFLFGAIVAVGLAAVKLTEMKP